MHELFRFEINLLIWMYVVFDDMNADLLTLMMKLTYSLSLINVVVFNYLSSTLAKK